MKWNLPKFDPYGTKFGGVVFHGGGGYIRAHRMQDEGQTSPSTDIHSEPFLRSLMARQLKLSIACALMFLVALLGLPLANFFWPELMTTRVFGFTLTWFVLGVLFFPLVWIISYFFIRRSIALERAEVEEVSRGGAKETKV
jgi:uncharacterized membrane protein (DUF485 family)